MLHVPKPKATQAAETAEAAETARAAIDDRSADRAPDAVRATTRAVLTAPGHTAPALRRAVFARAQGPAAARGADDAASIPDPVRAYADKVAHRAYAITDADTDGLLRGGYSEDEVFEVTVVAALGAGVARLERGLSVVAEARRRRQRES